MLPTVMIESRKDSMAAHVGDETVILHPTTGEYFGLDSVGTRVWQHIQSPIRYSDLIEQLLEEYDVSRDELERDVSELLEQLQAERLITTDTVYGCITQE